MSTDTTTTASPDEPDNQSPQAGRQAPPPVSLHHALNRLDRLYNRLTEDYQAAWGQPVDYSDIASFPGESGTDGRNVVPTPQPWLGVTYPQAISILYINEQQLRQIRADSRTMAQTNPFCIGAARNRIAYTVGKGHTYKFSLIDPDAFDDVDDQGHTEEGDELLSACRNIIDKFLVRNRWGQRQKETVRRMDRDGECFRRFFIDAQEGEVDVRFIEPLCVQDPGQRPTGARIYFGIEFKTYDNGVDMETPVAFYVKDIGALSETQGEAQRVDAAEVQHLKANVDMDTPRGLPTWYALRNHLQRAVTLLKNITTVAGVQASIAMIRKHIGSTRNLVERALTKDAPRQTDQQGQPDNVHRYKAGTIMDLPEITDVQFPQQGIEVDRYVAGVQAELRACGAALGMPEFMVSGDASNANYSSTMVAEGPAVKTFEEMQQDLIDADLVVIKLQLTVSAAVEGSGIPDNILELVKVEAEPPIIKSENRLQETQADVALVNAGAMSKDTLAARNNLEYETEKAKIDQDKDSGVGYGDTGIPPGAGGKPGQPQPGQGGQQQGQQVDADGNPIPQQQQGQQQQLDADGNPVKPTEPSPAENVQESIDRLLPLLQEYNDLHHNDGKFTDPSTFAHLATAKATASGKPEDHQAAQQAQQRAADKATDPTVKAAHAGYAAMHRDKSEATPPAVTTTAPTALVEVPDIRQPNHWACGACASMEAGRYFGVGPFTEGEWEKALGTSEEKSTAPQAIVAYLTKLGLNAQPKQGMTVDDLAAETAAGHPVIVCCQDYVSKEERSPKALWDYGHYLVCLGVVGQGTGRYLVFQDSSIENLDGKPGGDVPASKAEDADNIEAPGRILVREVDWLNAWHDVGEDGTIYQNYGIVVSQA